MKVWLAAVLLGLSATGGVAEVIKLSNGGKLELFPVGRWSLASEDVGEMKITLVALNPQTNARAVYSVVTEGSDEFPTDEKLRVQVGLVGERLLASGDFVERKPIVKPFYPQAGFGYYLILTDRRQVGQPSAPGKFKILCLGMIRLAPAIYLKVQILAESEEAEPYQQLLGMAEGAAYTPR